MRHLNPHHNLHRSGHHHSQPLPTNQETPSLQPHDLPVRPSWLWNGICLLTPLAWELGARLSVPAPHPPWSGLHYLLFAGGFTMMNGVALCVFVLETQRPRVRVAAGFYLVGVGLLYGVNRLWLVPWLGRLVW